MTKRCRRCGTTKLFSEFPKEAINKDGLYKWCRTCNKNVNREYYKTNRDRILKRCKEDPVRSVIQKIYNKSPKAQEKMKDRFLQKRYGITLAQRNEMLKNQNGCCAICGKHEMEFKKSLHVDHNHSTKRVRALLCYFCNARRVGKLNLRWAKAVYEYLLKYDVEDT